MTTKNSFILMRIRTNANADVDIPSRGAPADQ